MEFSNLHAPGLHLFEVKLGRISRRTAHAPLGHRVRLQQRNPMMMRLTFGSNGRSTSQDCLRAPVCLLLGCMQCNGHGSTMLLQLAQLLLVHEAQFLCACFPALLCQVCLHLCLLLDFALKLLRHLLDLLLCVSKIYACCGHVSINFLLVSNRFLSFGFQGSSIFHYALLQLVHHLQLLFHLLLLRSYLLLHVLLLIVQGLQFSKLY
mmetsp:Transcript_84339/g.149086  ORF Transcript_84339/g.149086 Transcript_84339/m.149086 type:complete len:207 (-) Transcript_84339:1299-1919(-)